MIRFVLACLCLTVLAVWSPLPARADESESAQLAARYAPILYLPIQDKPCADNGDPFPPVPVDVVLGNPNVTLVDGDRTVTAPTAHDLYSASPDAYLDFPGDPRHPECDYERDFLELPPQPPTAYARLVVDPARPGVALQYWFFSYFNAANNTHEGDWEMVQLSWDVATVAEALSIDPARVSYAQHRGGERATWGDAKVEKEGSRPVVNLAKGSHAAYFEPRIYWRTSVVGCDDATGAASRLDVVPVVVPDAISGPDDPFAWLAFTGRWGEEAPGRWTGARGPNTSRQWTDPFGWEAGLRTRSIELARYHSDLPSPADGVCLLARTAAWWANLDTTNPFAARGLVVIVVAAIVALVVHLRRQLVTVGSARGLVLVFLALVSAAISCLLPMHIVLWPLDQALIAGMVVYMAIVMLLFVADRLLPGAAKRRSQSDGAS